MSEFHIGTITKVFRLSAMWRIAANNEYVVSGDLAVMLSSMWHWYFSEWPLIMSNVPCKSLPCLCPPSSWRPHHAGVCKHVCMHVYLQGRAWQQHIWLLSGPWKCNSDLEVLRCLFIARSLGAWPYSQWHFQPLICRHIVMEYLSLGLHCVHVTPFSRWHRGRAAHVVAMWL